MAGRIPKQFIDDLLQRTDIVEVIDTRVPLKKAGKDYKACCPFHDEKTPSFTVSADKQFYHCFGCGAHGTAIGFLMEYDHMSFPEAVEELAAHAGVPIPQEAAFEPKREQVGPDLLKLLEDAARFYRQQLRTHAQAQQAVDYLKGRGITGEVAHEFGLGYAPEGWDNLTSALGTDASRREALVAAGLAVKKEGGGYYDRFRNRIMFPIHDYRGRIVGFGGRVLGKDEPKYLNSPETALFHKGRELYGLFRAREAIKRENCILVVEGYMDVVALAQFGIDYAVATLGTATTREHLERLFRYAPDIVFCFDGDRAGREAAWRALETTFPVLHEGRQASFLFLPEGEDPDTLVRKEGAEAFQARVRQAQPLPDYFFATLRAQVDLDRLDGRARLAELARPHLAKLVPGVLRELLLEQLARLSQLDRSRLAALLKTDAPAVAAPRPAMRPLAPKEPPSAVRIALALLAQNPGLAAGAPSPHSFGELDQPGMALFRLVLGQLQEAPAANTAALLERFRGSEHEATLAKLAAWEHPTLTQNVEAEFAGVLEQLRKTQTKFRAEKLLQKQHSGGLSDAEKAELARLLSGKRSAEVSPGKD
jgi:DNA primase